MIDLTAERTKSLVIPLSLSFSWLPESLNVMESSPPVPVTASLPFANVNERRHRPSSNSTIIENPSWEERKRSRKGCKLNRKPLFQPDRQDPASQTGGGLVRVISRFPVESAKLASV